MNALLIDSFRRLVNEHVMSFAHHGEQNIQSPRGYVEHAIVRTEPTRGQQPREETR